MLGAKFYLFYNCMDNIDQPITHRTLSVGYYATKFHKNYSMIQNCTGKMSEIN